MTLRLTKVSSADANGQPRRRARGIGLLEVLMAVTIFAFTIMAFVAGLSSMVRHNRELTNRAVATAKAMELLELVNALNYDNIEYGALLKEDNPDPWEIPADSTTYTTLITEDFDATTGEFVQTSGEEGEAKANKLKNGAWAMEISEIVQNEGTPQQWAFKRVTVTIRWSAPLNTSVMRYVVLTTDVSPLSRI